MRRMRLGSGNPTEFPRPVKRQAVREALMRWETRRMLPCFHRGLDIEWNKMGNILINEPIL